MIFVEHKTIVNAGSLEHVYCNSSKWALNQYFSIKSKLKVYAKNHLIFSPPKLGS